jgi:hypothetical protein
VAAILGTSGAHAPRRERVVVPPTPTPGQIAVLVDAGIGDYRAGDELWLDRLAPDAFTRAMNRDVLVPRPAGRFLFGRLIGREGSGSGGGKIQLLPLGAGARQTVLADPPWIAMATRLVRNL